MGIGPAITGGVFSLLNSAMDDLLAINTQQHCHNHNHHHNHQHKPHKPHKHPRRRHRRNPSSPANPPTIPAPIIPATIRGLLSDLLNEQIQITTPFTTLTGTVISVEMDYVAMVEPGGELYFVRLDKINTVTRVTRGV
ncbi:uncharacterized protein DUF2642 [Mesobacillus foraminis]|uniref:Uncharacterized protein DUF2642 n=2 Tax=Mesobacillus foraminis TaxID=279826 RepID=A0A4R2BPE6_9BACI|nr:uncharacterized protein DUF2642 [Mesobacillus foraminis]